MDNIDNTIDSVIPTTTPDLLDRYTEQKEALDIIDKGHPILKQLRIYFTNDYILNNLDDIAIQRAELNFRIQTDTIRNIMFCGELTFELESNLVALESKFSMLLNRSSGGFERIMQQTQIRDVHNSNTDSNTSKGWASTFVNNVRRVFK